MNQVKTSVVGQLVVETRYQPQAQAPLTKATIPAGVVVELLGEGSATTVTLSIAAAGYVAMGLAKALAEHADHDAASDAG